MIWLAVTAVWVVCGYALRDEFRPGGMLSLRPPTAASDYLAEIFELPLPDGVEAYDVLATLDWIEAL